MKGLTTNVTSILDRSHLESVEGFESLKEAGIVSNQGYRELCLLSEQYHSELHDVANFDGPEDEYWQRFQKLFGFASAQNKIIPMNAANLCPEPTRLLEMSNRLRLEYNINVAQQTRTAPNGIRVEQLRQTRQAVAKGLGCSESDLAILRNASEGNNAISVGYRHWTRTSNVSERENVVIWTENHPTNSTAWKLRREWEASLDSKVPALFEIKEVTFAPEDFTPGGEDRIFDRFCRLIDSKTRFVSFSETSNGSGERIPMSVIKRLWERITITHRHEYSKCHIHIDATMAWGVADPKTDFPLKYCHSFVSSAHKWFLGPKEIGILYMHPSKVKNFSPSIFAYDYKIHIESDWQDMPENAHRFELIGQRDDVNIITLLQTQTMWNALFLVTGPNRNPAERVTTLANNLKSGLVACKWKLKTPISPQHSRGVVRIEAPREDLSKEPLMDWIYKNTKFPLSGGGGVSPDNDLSKETFRLCPHIYNTDEDIRRAVDCMNVWRNI